MHEEGFQLWATFQYYEMKKIKECFYISPKINSAWEMLTCPIQRRYGVLAILSHSKWPIRFCENYVPFWVVVPPIWYQCFRNSPWFRLLHSPTLVAVENETMPPIGCHHPFVILWSKCRLGLPLLKWIMGWHDWWEFPQFFRGHWQSPHTALYTAGNYWCLGCARRLWNSLTLFVLPACRSLQ